MAPSWSKGFFDIQATTECRFTLKHVRDMIIKHIQIHRPNKYSQHSSIIWPVWLTGSVFVYELSYSVFKFRGCHSNFYDNFLKFEMEFVS